jgi:LmbE family N-acetylglucosaminyl deacetylase
MKIIAIGAHLDDIELACGGTLAKAVGGGAAVKMVVLSQSGYTFHDGRVMRLDETALDEGRRAAAVLGVDDLIVLDWPAKDIPYHSEVVEPLDRLITDFEPDLIFGHWPFDTHQAHQATSLSTISAARYFNSILLYEPITPSGRSYVAFRPQVYSDITGFIDRKIESLKAHRTEYEKYGERWLEAVKARANHRGFEMGVDFAEAFEVMRLELKI